MMAVEATGVWRWARATRGNPYRGFGLAIALVSATFLLRLALGPLLAGFPFLFFLPAILISTFAGGAAAGVLAAILALFLAQYFFIPPQFSLWPQGLGGWLGITIYALTAAMMIGLMSVLIRLQEAQETARDRLRELNAELERLVEERTASLKQEMEQHGQSLAQLRQLQKMEAIGQLTGGVAHDFNNMLAIIIGSLDLAKRKLRGDEDPRVAHCIASATEGAQRAAVLTSRLLAFARQQPLAPQALDINRLVGGMSEMLRRTLGESIQVETVLAGGAWKAFADASQLENAVLNLAVNARDAMPDGGKLTIETANSVLDDRYARLHNEVEPGQYVMISVTDTGTGMPPEVVERAFDPFYTTKETGRGTGLGLSQVFGYVKQSGGHVKIYSEPGHGTTVKIYLPRHLGSSLSPAEQTATAEVPQGDPSRIILVVEDEEQVRNMSIDALRELGYTVIHAASGKDALAQLEANAHIDLLFTDIVMPEMNGRQLADRARESRPGLKVLFTTGYTRNAVVHNGVLDHGVNFLPKPFTIEELARKVSEVLGASQREEVR